MKLGRPVYDSSLKIYNCSITNGTRFSARKEEGRFVPELESCINKEELAEFIVTSSQGWFTKPLTKEYLKDRIKTNIPTTSIPEGFEGTLEWQMSSLVISKDTFTLGFEIVSQKQDEQICISFEEETSNAPTRRHLLKEKVLKARAKAARCLFQAEHLTQEYCQEFGDTTDWEEEDEDEDED